MGSKTNVNINIEDIKTFCYKNTKNFGLKIYIKMSQLLRIKVVKLFKQFLTFENYLINIKNIKYRQILTKSRISSHILNIEAVRAYNISANERVCLFCPELVEDEIRFLVK